MRKLREPDLPKTLLITDPNTLKYAEALNRELDGFRREINRFVGKAVINSPTEDVTLTAEDDIVLANGTFTVTVPLALDTKGRVYYIKNIGTGTITVSGSNSETIDGETTVDMATQYDVIAITSDNTEWWIITRYIQ